MPLRGNSNNTAGAGVRRFRSTPGANPSGVGGACAEGLAGHDPIAMRCVQASPILAQKGESCTCLPGRPRGKQNSFAERSVELK